MIFDDFFLHGDGTGLKIDNGSIFFFRKMPKQFELAGHYLLFVEILGVAVLICFASMEQLKEATKALDTLVVPFYRRPDLIIRVPKEMPIYLLYRTPTEVERRTINVTWSEPPFSSERRWEGNSPLIPPLMMPTMQNRFIIMHGSCVLRAPGQASLYVGERGSGKTTLALLAHERGLGVLADETTVVSGCDLAAQYFIVAPHHWMDGEKRRCVPSQLFGSVKPPSAAITSIYILSARGNCKEPQLSEVEDANKKFRQLMPHLRSIGNDARFDVMTLARLTRVVRVYQIEASPTQDHQFLTSVITSMK